MTLTLDQLEDRLTHSLKAFQDAPSFSKDDKRNRLISQADLLCRNENGVELLYHRMPELDAAGLFAGTVWEDPNQLVAGLVKGTLLAGPPTSTVEVLNELRILNISEGRIQHPAFSPEQAEKFLHQMMVTTFELAFEDFSHPGWSKRYAAGELKKIEMLFSLIKKRLDIGNIKPALLEEIEVIVAHRPVVVTRIKRILRVIDEELELDLSEEKDRKLQYYIRTLFRPSELARKYEAHLQYEVALEQLSAEALKEECLELGQSMFDTGLVSDHQLVLLHYVLKRNPALVPEVLALNAHGLADYERHENFVTQVIQDFIVPGNKQAIYGLARVLQRNILSRKTAWHAINRFVKIDVDPEVAKRLLQGNLSDHNLTAMQSLIGGTLCVLGLPLGVRQGNNPTCQSARGISMWSRHAPAKLINMLIDAATSNNVVFRYEGDQIESADVIQGLTQQFDLQLDPVSITLVPLLDKVYNEMMKRAGLKHFGKDPHASVNPAFYGHWIQTGFRSVYNPTFHAIEKYDEFVRIFYASFHPDYNGGHHLIYPVPTGIFITNASAQMLGYHAISLLRIEEAPETNEWRAYFFNPNSQGKQDWGQDIQPTVWGNGERHGESSLPVNQFVSRVYAYHFNELRLEDKHLKVPADTVTGITKLSKESWGLKYRWI
jgi:hypothetical protein